MESSLRETFQMSNSPTIASTSHASNDIPTTEIEYNRTMEASITYYTSYPPCCPNSPNFDFLAPTSECNDYSGCNYIGLFAAIGYQPLSYVQT
jgi:hypothetical protein